MKDFPPYVTIKYYYSDKKTSDVLLFGESAHKNGIHGELCGSLILTNDWSVYLNQHCGGIITPDSLVYNRMVPYEWLNDRQIQYAIEYQPYDFDECWSKGHSMYSKEFWNTALSDMKIYLRDQKIKMITSNEKINWIS